MNKKNIQLYIDSPKHQQKLYRKTLWMVVFSQIFGGAGLAAGITVGALLAQNMIPSDSFAGVPAALFTLGSALAALLVGRVSQRFGRRLGLSIGFLTGGIGAIGVIIAAVNDSIFLLFLSLFIYGSGTATNLQARYAGTDLANPKQRGTAVSVALVSTTLGAVAGPNLVGVMGDVALSLNIPPLAGPFILAAAAFILAGLVILFFLRPDPLVVAKAIDQAKSMNQHKEILVQPLNKNGIIVGATVMILTQIVMIAIMTMTPVHMEEHDHSLGAIGFVIGIHIGAMYLPSLFTGILVDKIGRIKMAVASGITLLAAGLTAALVPEHSMVGLTVALALLGLGWNFGLISGTALIVDATTIHTRAKMQGNVDVLIALAGASGGALSGMVVAETSFPILSISGGFLSLLLIPVMIWYRKRMRMNYEV